MHADSDTAVPVSTPAPAPEPYIGRHRAPSAPWWERLRRSTGTAESGAEPDTELGTGSGGAQRPRP